MFPYFLAKAPPGVEETTNNTKKKKKKKKIELSDLTTRKPFGGSKIENETIRVIRNYNGANTIHKGKRVLRRLGPQGQGPLPATSVPPWIGPCYYSKSTADKILYGHPTKGCQTPFKSVGREPKPMSEIKRAISLKKEWSGLFSGPNSVYGAPSIPFSSKASVTDHSECVTAAEPHVWSKWSAETTMGARQDANHIKNAPTPYMGHKTIRTSSPKRRRKTGLLDGKIRKIDINKERIFDASQIDDILYDEDNRGGPDDESSATSVFGDNDEFDAGSIGSSSSLSTQKRYDAISLLSKSVNFSVFTGFSVDNVMKKFVSKKKMTRDLADYTMGALDSYNESVAECLKFTDPSKGDVSCYASQAVSLTHTPVMSPRPGDLGSSSPENVTPRGLSRSLSSIAQSHQDENIRNTKSTKKAGSVAGLLQLSPQKTKESAKFSIPGKVTKKNIAAAPGRSSYRRGAILPAPLLDDSSVESADTATPSYRNLNSELLKSRNLSRSRSNIEKLPSFQRQPSLRRQKTADNLTKSLSRSMPKLSLEETTALIETGISVNLGGLLLPGEGIDQDGLAASYSPPETPRIITPKKDDVNQESLDDAFFELDGDIDEEDFLFEEDEYLKYLTSSGKKKKKKIAIKLKSR